ncbi:MAG: aldehyde dehydrogenase family protein [Cloacibacillus evryensis]
MLAAGCCTVFKPSSLTPLSVLELARLISGILPPGVFNVVTGKGSKAGQFMLGMKDSRKLAFTGSTDVGGDVAKAAAHRLIPQRSNWAANRRTSTSPTANGIWRWTACSSASSSTRGRSAAPARAYSYMRTSTTNS